MKFRRTLLVLVILGVGLAIGIKRFSPPHTPPRRATPPLHKKLYWFIPDGMRAEPELFNIYQWAEAGELPHIKMLMDRGSYGYAIPEFPSHTPTNFATLLTGCYPERHGVVDGPMHVEGKPLNKVAIGGFSSVAKKVPPVWMPLEAAGKTVCLLSIPGSTPPELQRGYTFRGRWGGWGADFPALLFETKGNLAHRIAQGRSARLFFFGPELTRYIDQHPAEGWTNPPPSFSPPFEMALEAWGATVYALVTDSTDDGAQNYDRVSFSLNKHDVFASLKSGERSGWTHIPLVWKVGETAMPVATDVLASVVKLDADGFFRLRLFYNNLNTLNTQPGEAATRLLAKTGPMVDFVDNFPAQLVHYPEDKQAFLAEMRDSFEWHRRAVGALLSEFQPDVVIHDIYSPNQMLTSRWWMGYIDPHGTRYATISEPERAVLWQEVKEMYKRLDAIIGEILAHADAQTYIVLSSDHGAVPLNHWVNLNNYFAQRGWLTFSIDPTNGEPIIDWAKTKVVFLKMAHVYIHPDGLAGDYHRASGPAYDALRNDVIRALQDLRDEQGATPLVDVVKWEDAQHALQLSPDRVGDLVIANAPGFGWSEEMSADLKVFSDPLVSGYKQAIKSEHVPGMLTPFIIAGPGVKRHHFLGVQPIRLVDEVPTLLRALNQAVPSYVQGKVLDVFEPSP